MMKRPFLALVSALVPACGHSDHHNNPPTGNDLTIEIHRNFPFVDGDTADDATFVAVQDGDDDYVAATGDNGVYHVHVESDRFGIAVGCLDPVSNFASIEIVQRVPADGTTYKTGCKAPPATANIQVNVTNLPANDRLRLRTGFSIATTISDGPVTLVVPLGTTELFGTLTDENLAVVRVFRIPAIQVHGDVNLTLDAVADGAPPDFHPLTLAPADPTATVRTAVDRPYGNIGLQSAGGSPLGTTPRYLTLPAALQQADDLYNVTVSGTTGTQTHVVKTPGSLAFQLPAAFVAPNPTLAKTPFLHPTWTFTPTTSALPIQSYFMDAGNFFDFTVPVFRDWFVTISSGWIDGASTVSYEFPDLSGMPGFADVALQPHERIDTSISRDETSSDVTADGTVFTSSTSTGTVGEFCGDGIVQSGETCDPGPDFETATCDSDCTAVVCGDGVANFAAGEDCDPPDGTTCDATCKVIP